MRRLIAVVAIAALLLTIWAGQASADGYADLDDGVLEQGIESDPTNDGEDGADDDGSTIPEVDDGGQDDAEGIDAPPCIVENQPDPDVPYCGDGAYPDQDGEEQPPPPPVNPLDLGGQVLDSMLLPSPKGFVFWGLNIPIGPGIFPR